MRFSFDMQFNMQNKMASAKRGHDDTNSISSDEDFADSGPEECSTSKASKIQSILVSKLSCKSSLKRPIQLSLHPLCQGY